MLTSEQGASSSAGMVNSLSFLDAPADFEFFALQSPPGIAFTTPTGWLEQYTNEGPVFEHRGRFTSPQLGRWGYDVKYEDRVFLSALHGGQMRTEVRFTQRSAKAIIWSLQWLLEKQKITPHNQKRLLGIQFVCNGLNMPDGLWVRLFPELMNRLHACSSACRAVVLEGARIMMARAASCLLAKAGQNAAMLVDRVTVSFDALQGLQLTCPTARNTVGEEIRVLCSYAPGTESAKSLLITRANRCDPGELLVLMYGLASLTDILRKHAAN